MTNKKLILTVLSGLFIERDFSIFDKFFSHDYKQHNPHIPNGTLPLKEIISSLSERFSYEPGIILEEGNIVMIHGRYKDWNGKNMIAVDIFRVNNGKITEHWDVMQEEISAEFSANGNSMFPILL